MASWENIFNVEESKNKLVSRFDEYYRLVRSSTKSPDKVKEIPTDKPHNYPGNKFYYRFRKIISTIVHKTHITYELSEEKMKRYNELFFDSKLGEVTEFNLLNYNSLEDNATYIIRTFIRGPVCRGNISLNVIDDHF